MESKNQILRDLGFSDELIAQLNSTGKFICNEEQTNFEFVSIETEDFAELIISDIDSPFISNLVL